MVNISNFDEELSSVRQGVQSLQTSVNRLQSSIGSSYNNIKGRLRQLSNMWEATEMLRKVDRFLKSLSKLKAAYSDHTLTALDLNKAALPLFELEEMLRDQDLQGIDVVQSEVAFIKKTGSGLRSASKQQLTQAIQTRNQSQIGSSLQVFFNLESLQQVVHQIVEQNIHKSQQLMHKTFDLKNYTKKHATPGTISRPSNSTDQSAVKSQFLTSFNTMLEELHDLHVQIHQLDQVLVKKKDPLTLVGFESVVRKGDEPSVLGSYWIRFNKSFTKELQSVLRAPNSMIKNMLLEEYPYILKMLNEFVSQFKGLLPAATLDASASADPTEQALEWMRLTVSDLEREYLSGSYSRLSNRIQIILSKIQPPTSSNTDGSGITHQDAKLLSNILSQELNNSRNTDDDRLHAHTLRNVNKCIDLICADVENKIVRVPNQYRLEPNYNHNIFNAGLYYAINKIYDVVCVGHSGQHSLQSTKGVQQLARFLLQPFFEALQQTSGACLNRMFDPQALHDGSYLTDFESQLKNSKRILTVLFQQLKSVRSGTIISEALQDSARNLIHLFVRNISTSTVVNDDDGMLLIDHVARFERALSDSLWDVDQIDDWTSYKMIKGVKKLLYARYAVGMESSQQNQLIQDVVKGDLLNTVSVVNLIMYHRDASDHLTKLPHEMMGVSVQEYNKFLQDNHSSPKPIYKIQERCVNEIDEEKLNEKMKLVRDLITSNLA
ncbi:oligomeric Golgi complex subunit 5 [Acrasis kona]|uniref:Oligomeric Golgi complex subunit 5 n=1 Tax=Acrasis kona TaxID=1008807 RepID=A0AAW2ZC45_9EUKA